MKNDVKWSSFLVLSESPIRASLTLAWWFGFKLEAIFANPIKNVDHFQSDKIASKNKPSHYFWARILDALSILVGTVGWKKK